MFSFIPKLFLIINREVHLSDLHRADQGNPDTKPDEPTMINWAKYNMIGQFIAYTVSIQERFSAAEKYKLQECLQVSQLLDIPVMDYEACYY